MTTLSTLLLVYCWVAQNPKEVEFFYNGKFYSFSLPSEHYKADTLKYTEGVFITYTFNDLERVTLHVGGDQRKPILRSRDYVVKDEVEANEKRSRSGYIRKTKLCWQEDTLAEGAITLYFTNVSSENRKLFEECLMSLHVTKIIR